MDTCVLFNKFKYDVAFKEPNAKFDNELTNELSIADLFFKLKY